MPFLARTVIKYQVIMRGLPLQKLNNHVPLQFRVCFQSTGTLCPGATESFFWSYQRPNPSNYQFWNTFKKKLIFLLVITERYQQQAHYLICCHRVMMCISDTPSFMTRAHPIPGNSQSHSQKGFCMLLKSLKYLFPVYMDICKGTPKETGLQRYRVPTTALSGCGNQSQPLNHLSAWAGIALFRICSFMYQASGSQTAFLVSLYF